jgi:hypothetical protein
LQPDFDLLGELTARTGKLAQAAEEASERTGAQPMAVKVVRAAEELPVLLSTCCARHEPKTVAPALSFIIAAWRSLR